MPIASHHDLHGPMPSEKYDLAVIGGGIIGLSTAMQYAEQNPKTKIVVLEKEPGLAMHQTGHNSGVIHSGIYYRPGSAKARMCVSGKKALLEFCDREGIPYNICGKVILATRKEQFPQLQGLMKTGKENGVEDLELIGPERLNEIEPNATGLMALYSPNTGIIDFGKVAQAYAKRFQTLGGGILTSTALINVTQKTEGLILETSSGEVHCKYLINCAGLYTDRLAQLTAKEGLTKSSAEITYQIVPFRGEYYKLNETRRHLVRGLIYPLPDSKLPFLGVHFTRTVHGDVEVGPNAVLAFAREGYRMFDVNPKDLWQTLTYRGFWAMARAHWKAGLDEYHRSLSKGAFVRALQQLVPEMKSHDLLPAGGGVRAQAVSSSGQLIDDFVISPSPRAIHVINAPSPGATASLAIGRRICDIAAKTFS